MRDCPATQEAVWELVDAGGTDRCTLCGGLPDDHLPEDPNEGIEGPWAEGGACGDQYDYQRGAIGGWRS